MKRFFLNVSFIILAFILAFWTNENLHLRKCTAVVTGYRSDNSDISPEVTFTVKGSKYTRTFAESVKKKYEIGDKLEITYDNRRPGAYVYRHDFISMLIPVILIMIICREGFNGYIDNFVYRYPKACMLTVFSTAIFIWYLLAVDIGYIVGAEGWAKLIILGFLIMTIPTINIIVWITATVRYKNKISQEENEQEWLS